MKINTAHTNTLLLLTMFSLGASNASAETNILANSGKFKPAIVFSDTYAERLFTFAAPPPEPGLPRDPATHDIFAAPERISAKIVANLAAFDFATEITEDMPIAVRVGAFQFIATLGQDGSRTFDRDGNPKPFDPKKTSATFYYGVDVLDADLNPKVDTNGNPIRRKVGSLVFAWNTKAKTLTVTLANSDVGGSGASPIAAANFVGAGDDGIKGGRLSFAGEPVAVAVTFGTATGLRAAYAKGISQTSYRKFGSDAAGTLEGPFAIHTVTVQGSADVTAPTLVATVPAKDADVNGLIDLSGTVTDLPPGTFSGTAAALTVVIYVNDSPDPVSADVLDPSTEGPDPKGKHLFTAADVALSKSVNTLTIVATDGDGNSRSVQKKVTTKASF